MSEIIKDISNEKLTFTASDRRKIHAEIRNCVGLLEREVESLSYHPEDLRKVMTHLYRRLLERIVTFRLKINEFKDTKDTPSTDPTYDPKNNIKLSYAKSWLYEVQISMLQFGNLLFFMRDILDDNLLQYNHGNFSLMEKTMISLVVLVNEIEPVLADSIHSDRVEKVVKQLNYLESHIKEILEGKVSNVTGW